ncbi:hypothetical protein CC2G_013541 [Coprinopsis cinerea AmutBmut pab1-1]|nr:hypothetical protein CC2G_013541 [Coprinopsis cinerea AmutBmut pab1-1]
MQTAYGSRKPLNETAYDNGGGWTLNVELLSPSSLNMGSLAIVNGIFALSNGRKLPSNNSRISQAIYSTVFHCANGQRLHASVRMYTPPHTALYPNHTVIWLIAKFYVPPGQIDQASPVLLESLLNFKFPGNPSDPSYDNHLPTVASPSVFLLGNVHGNTEHIASGCRIFSLAVADWVRDATQHTIIQCLFENNQRWSRVPSPYPSSCVGVIGTVDSFQHGGLLHIRVVHLALNARPQDPVINGNTNDSFPGDGSPPKRRKYDAILNPIQPLPSTSTLSSPAASSSNSNGDPVPPSPSGSSASDVPSPTSKAKRRSAPKSSPKAKTTKSKPARKSTRKTATTPENDEPVDPAPLPEADAPMDDFYVPDSPVPSSSKGKEKEA